MQLKQDDIEKFKALYQKHFGTEIDNKEALDLGLALVNHTKIILLSNQKYRGKK